MRPRTLLFPLLLIITMVLTPETASAEEIRVAVASNFTGAMKAVAERFEASTGHKVILIFGSTGKHYAQIVNGAPIDAFFAADTHRPELLEKERVALPGSRFTYAVGKIVLWSPRKGYVDADGSILKQGDFRHLAIANPKLAPYGMAAREVLKSRGVWDDLRTRIVRGENIGQAFQFVRSGNAELGFVALAQVKRPGHPIAGSWWDVPQSLYTPVKQQAVRLSKRDAVRAFMSYVRSDEARKIIRSYGYETP